MAREDYRGGAAALTLNADFTAGDLTFSVTGDTSGWPTGASGRPFTVVIDRGKASEEKLLCATLTPTAIAVSSRGYDGTSDANHTAGALIEHVGPSATKMDDVDTHVYDPTRDDHTQYVLTNGTRAFFGTDAITAVPGGVGGTVNGAGSANTLARSDHQHAISASGISDSAMFTAQVVNARVIADASIGTTKMIINSVDATILADNAVDSAAILTGAVTPIKTSVIPYCRLTSTFPTGFADNTTILFTGWNSEMADTDSMHDPVTNPGRITCTTAGIYHVQASLRFAVPSGTLTLLVMELRRIGVVEERKELPLTSTSTTPVTMDVSVDVPCLAGDYWELWVKQISGQSLTPTINNNYSPTFSATWVGKAV